MYGKVEIDWNSWNNWWKLWGNDEGRDKFLISLWIPKLSKAILIVHAVDKQSEDCQASTEFRRETSFVRCQTNVHETSREPYPVLGDDRIVCKRVICGALALFLKWSETPQHHWSLARTWVILENREASRRAIHLIVRGDETKARFHLATMVHLFKKTSASGSIDLQPRLGKHACLHRSLDREAILQKTTNLPKAFWLWLGCRSKCVQERNENERMLSDVPWSSRNEMSATENQKTTNLWRSVDKVHSPFQYLL